MPYVLSAFADEAGTGLSEQMRICSDVGIRYIEMRGVNGKNVSALTAAEAKEIKKILDDGGFKVSSAGSPIGKIGVTDDFAPHLELFKRTVENSHILGTGLMRMFSFYIPDGDDPKKHKGAVLERLGALLDAADGIKLCHENEGGIYGESAENCLELYEAFGGRLALVFDPANFVHCGKDVKQAYEMLKGGFEYFHIKDCVAASKKIVPAGFGDGMIAEFLADYDHAGKDVFLSLEPHLKIFEGYAGLERGEKASVTEDFAYETNEQAFTAAAGALKNVLRSIGITA